MPLAPSDTTTKSAFSTREEDLRGSRLLRSRKNDSAILCAWNLDLPRFLNFSNCLGPPVEGFGNIGANLETCLLIPLCLAAPVILETAAPNGQHILGWSRLHHGLFVALSSPTRPG